MKLQRLLATALVASLGIAACSTPGPDSTNQESGDPTRVGFPSVDAALAAVRARPGVTESTSDGWTVIEDKARRETWLFSPAGHPAHPAVVKRTIVKRMGGTTIQTAAMCGPGRAECDKLVAEFDAADRKSADKAREAGQPGMPAGPSRPAGRY